MNRRGRQTYKKQDDELQLGVWLIRLGVKPGELAKDVGVTAAYMSELISGKKLNPGIHLLLAISKKLGITVNDLYGRPPPAAVTRLNPGQLAALSRLLKEIEPSKK